METYEQDSRLKTFLKTLRLKESTISMVLGALVVVVVGVLIYNYFANINRPEQPIVEEGVKLVEEEGELVPEALPTSHTVAAGEDLWKIAQTYYESGYNWVDIAKENKLVNANLIEVGQELTIPRTPVIKVEVASEPELSILETEYVVVKGDFLWEIAVRAYGDGYRWPEIYEANADQIADPNVIEVGQVLTLPR
ncbi:MAG: hypothetical protein UX85_C0007G0013 [Candidatus Beckwithbacteria bacterium GW2011_GWB1_47_15]|uniref:LysM domain-containing protein n=1 Tax=Candidatus Beckwithbacteria bacterium GW2011_GWB1_47_15 TaxID=1618371 RepID=A0A0G1RUG0_9BACT|nr:MAG: peptidoglycan-binding LysM [Candidatus Beckwithbacteria bacterium GW2011_GWC1_49_16]KKU35082.1 MAG: hypothetical protein UX50_C0006G0008 [Candidatus Beckwithbacteria bacterium GW2011_GWA1_46_30]KKU60726.1 MAG: hypothetical protein UX85_C0007G0013 [Candidatus Beckwithbacteria bacterium GW2011_GWB1_47_15]KKU71531.1 MAG: hypothetical protein UX97_C0005G0014 [Candidatus Beckwithbacteria bacterium GW2011_GWA2_47_25]KKW03516.1 MAG: hypothetical protein UY37_C0005G0079 [Candidatus Beckwithbact